MTIGKHDCKIAGNTHLKQAIEIGLDEALTALEESFYDLTDEQVWAFPIQGRNNIAWIVMHCLHNLDNCGIGAQAGERLLANESRWNLWGCSEAERPKAGDSFPGTSEMLESLERIRNAAFEALTPADESELAAKVFDHPGKPTRSDFYMRTICHTMAHVRQIWALRGLLGQVSQSAWARQHWA
ncbi:MAG TPA: DinB family protein [Candidatus Hydrogenedentes bacterium]|nr:DinB family protein [Candidatus Hydrogenedentota bacterium]